MRIEEGHTLLGVPDRGGLPLCGGRQRHPLDGQGRAVDAFGPGDPAQQVLQVRGGGQILLLDDSQSLRVVPGIGQRHVVERLRQGRVPGQGRGGAH